MTTNIDIHIKNGYGILDFEHPFTFDKSNFYTMYAQNGTMKSSFSKVLDDHSKGIEIQDKLFNVSGTCTVTGIAPEDILSFPCYDGNVELSDEASLLVSNDEAKKAYDQAFKEVEQKYQAFAQKLAEVTRYSSGEKGPSEIVEKMYRTFVDESGDESPSITVPKVVTLLKATLTEVGKADEQFCDIAYSRLTGSNFTKFIENKKYQGFFEDLAKAYDEFRESPTYYRNGFDASSATKLIKAISDSKYFEAEHAVTLKDKSGTAGEPIETLDALKSTLKTDFDQIIDTYPHLKKALEALIIEFAVGTYGDVRTIFEDTSKRHLLLFMGNKDRFYKNMWYGYLAGSKSELDQLLKTYDESSTKIKAAIKTAEDSTSEWEEVKDIFNDRFKNLPYEIHITNKPDAIVNDTVKPVFEVRFENPRNPDDPYREKPDSQNKLVTLGSILSNGERKALYLLNVIFKLRSQIRHNRDTLVIFDDLVESFDYKNKYAFFEYLQDLSRDDNKLYIIVLTHNFDFYRLVYEKLNPHDDSQFKIILKAQDGTLSIQDMFNPRVFKDLKAKAPTTQSAWVGLIPLARNIVEYRHSSDHSDYMELTKCLHVMPDCLIVGDAVNVIKQYTGVDTSPFDATDTVHDAIIAGADQIARESDDTFDLYKNFTLAMATRIKIERYIISKITQQQYLDVVAHASDQTRKLITVYKNNSPDPQKSEITKIFNRAVMMVDGSIHINSFMYEPLVDMGTWELKEIYAKIPV